METPVEFIMYVVQKVANTSLVLMQDPKLQPMALQATQVYFTSI